jgi:dienelactone hydrolase
MRSPLCLALVTLVLGVLGPSAAAQDKPADQPAAAPVERVDAAPDRGFHWAYYLYVPAALHGDKRQAARTFLVLPNNTGKPDDDPAAHDRHAKRFTEGMRPWADRLGVVVLQPVFPRPQKDWRLYTQALDRDTLLTKKPGLERLDRQLVAMIDHAAARLAAENMPTDRKVLVFGFSASGMFANRFTFLHPDRVKAAAIGSPGGWPLAPAAEVHGKPLRYPVGTADWEAVTGAPLDLKALAVVPIFFIMGDQDANDSVIFRDSYEEEDEKRIGELFGTTPVARWPAAERLYRPALPLATFKLYPGVAHRLTNEMREDVLAFFQKYLGK